MDGILKVAVDRRAQLERQLGQVDDFLKLYNEFAAEAGRAVGELVPGGIGGGVGGAAHDSEKRVGRSEANGLAINGRRASKRATAAQSPAKQIRGARPLEIVEEACKVLKAAGQPLSRRQLLTALRERGLQLVGAQQLTYLGSILWRHNDRIVRLEEHGYWMRDEPYEPAGYEPTPGNHRSGRKAES